MTIEQTAKLESLMQTAFDKGAGVFYLTPGEVPMFRIHGELQRIGEQVINPDQTREIALDAAGEEKLRTLGTETAILTTSCNLPAIVDGHMHITKSSGQYNISVSLLPMSLPDINSVRLPKAVLDAAMEEAGLIVFSGSTGSGKTTTMLSTLDYINTNCACRICTIEHFLLYHLTAKKAMIRQHEVGTDIPDMVGGISSAMLQGMDVLMVGELRTAEEIQASVTAANVGHLVITQAHAKTPEGVIERFINAFVPADAPSFQKHLASSIAAISAQRLLPSADGKGQVAAYGVLIPDSEMREAIAAGRDIFDRKDPLPNGCQTLAEDIERLCAEGQITPKTKQEALTELA